MVKSGLSHDIPEYKEVRVSAYRLTAHLAMAVGLFSGLLWTGWSALHPERAAKAALAQGAARSVSRASHALTTLALATMLSGGFVAGNDAGRAFNDWPLYAGRWVPDGIWRDNLRPAWRNLAENTATVQFDHRTLAYTTLATATGLAVVAERAAARGAIPAAAHTGARAVAGLVWAQAALGIAALVTVVPVSLGSLHQAGALTVWTGSLYVMHALRYVRP